MLTSARRSISYPNPDRSDRPDVPLHIGNIITAIDNDVMFVNGTDAARVAASHQVGGGKFWWATDTQLMWYDDGTTWRQLGYAALASPAFTGTPTAPTAATATNTTQIATTAFVKAQNYAATVFGRSGPTITAQTGDYTVAQVTGAAPLASPVFTGDPQAPTPAAGDNDTSIATTAFARSLMPAGVILPYGGTAAPNAEWLLCDGTAKSRTTYAALFAAIGTAYGAGDGSTT